MTFNESFIIGISKSPGNNNKNVHSPYTLSTEIKRPVYSFALVGLASLYHCLAFINKNI